MLIEIKESKYTADNIQWLWFVLVPERSLLILTSDSVHSFHFLSKVIYVPESAPPNSI